MSSLTRSTIRSGLSGTRCPGRSRFAAGMTREEFAMAREQISLELMSFRERIDATVLMVTHSISEAILLADRILIYSGRPARIQEEIEVPFPRPRQPELRDAIEFTAMCRLLRKKLMIQE